MSASKLADLANRILRSSPVDKGEQKRILRLLNEVRDSLRWSNDRTTVEYLDAATLLISYLAQMGSIGGSEIRSVVARLIETASKVAGGDTRGVPAASEISQAASVVESALETSLEEGSEPAASLGQVPHLEPPKAGTQAASVRLISDMLLGEIMVRMGHIEPEHIEHALQTQRQTGVRFGEALIQLGVATWEQVQAGLRYQDNCRQVAENAQSRRATALPTSPRTKQDRGAVRNGPDVADSKPKKPSLELQSPQESSGGAPPESTGGGMGLRLMSDLLLGEILIDRRAITKEDLERALGTQRATGMRLGEALVANGACHWDQVKTALQIQGQMRRYVQEKNKGG